MLSIFKKLFGKGPENSPSADAPPPSQAVPAKKNEPGPDDITVSLKAVVAGMPDILKKKLDKKLSGSEVIWISKKEATEQLAKGAVKLPFTEIVKMVPGTFLPADPDTVGAMVSLPLAEILPKIKTLPRRAAQRQVEVPDDLAPVFGVGLEPTAKPVGSPPTASAPPPAPVAIPPPAPKPVPPQAPTPPPAPKVDEAYVPPAPKPLPTQEPISLKIPRPEAPAVPPPAYTPPAPAPVDPPAPIALPTAAPAPAPQVDEGPVIQFGDIFGQPDKTDWTPQEVVDKAATLRGVAGALITTADGLPVAFQLPSNLSGNTVAAFVPQMYTRIIQYTRDLKLGDPKHLTIMVENVPLQMFKAGNVYFTALGRPNENLPKPQLTAIALALARQSKS